MATQFPLELYLLSWLMHRHAQYRAQGAKGMAKRALARRRRKAKVPPALSDIAKQRRLDFTWERPPLPDEVRPREEDYIWASFDKVDCGRRIKPHPDMDKSDSPSPVWQNIYRASEDADE